MTTPHFGFFKPIDTTPMNNPALFFNDNWTKVEAILEQPIVASLPVTDFSYKSGMTVFRTGYNSTFICLGSNAAWGVFWRPVHTQYGPWTNLTNSALKDPATYKVSTTTPLQYRITADGRFQLRGAIERVSGVWPNYEATVTNIELFQPLVNTEGLQVMTPGYRIAFIATLDQPSTHTKPHVVLFDFEADGSSLVRTWNASATSTIMYLNGVEWDIMGSLNG